ncbi:MAG: hypothetical protein QOG69_1954, partial [Actinomycetota bacterium]|nr:hypothetical protein [Actinomycetota bacterium]
MCRMRVYVPATLAGLAATVAVKGLPDAQLEVAPAASMACAVTPA